MITTTYRELESYGFQGTKTGNVILEDGRNVPEKMECRLETLSGKEVIFKAVYEGTKSIKEMGITLAKYVVDIIGVSAEEIRSSGEDLGTLIRNLTGKFPEEDDDYYSAGIDF